MIFLFQFQPEYYKDAPHFHRNGPEGPEYRLEIPNAKLDFTGTYSIIAKNCHGEAKAIISLQIMAKGKLFFIGAYIDATNLWEHHILPIVLGGAEKALYKIHIGLNPYVVQSSIGVKCGTQNAIQSL